MEIEVVDIPDTVNDNDNDKNKNNKNIAGSVGPHDGRVTKCLACGKSADSRHFGSIACRACGAFFRRAIVTNKQFFCRCVLNKYVKGIADRSSASGRIFCRACRLKRCIEIGMRPEAVRAAHLRRFHEGRRLTTNLTISSVREASSEDEQQQEESLPKMEPSDLADLDSSYLNLLLSLLPLESRMHRIFSTTTLLPQDHYDKFKTLEDLIDYKENMLDQYSKFSVERFASWSRMQAINFLEKTGFWKCPQRLARFLQKLLLSVDMIKSLPPFSKLDVEDQKAILKESVRKCTQFFMAYFSLNVNNEAIVWDDGTNIFEIFSAVARHYKSDLMINAAHKVFINPMTEMNRVRPEKEEFVLLLAMLAINPASSGLSDKAKLLLNLEAEKYGKVLMQYEQNRLGQSAGVLRYMELQSLLWNAITSTYKVREMYIYFDTVLEQGCFDKAFPPVFRQLTLG